MNQIDLSKEERQKLKELQENPQFKKDWNILKICIYKSHPIPSIFILCLLILTYDRHGLKIPFIYPVLTFLGCVILYGRSGIIISGLILVYLYFLIRNTGC